ncbi:MAG: CRISPR-associated endonuclease Cas3'', partial [Actinobacteria bacterium]|nr:CRISPR-associated endonuclease Cas3'' [Actinomycetota bacterium]
MQLTCATRSIWAKTGRHDASGYGGETQLTHWLPLHRHLSDTAATAAKLWDQSFWAPAIRRRLTDRYDGDEAAARAVAILLAENHDVGKASPAFAVQCPELTGQMGDNGLKVRQTIKDHPDRALVRHELVSYLSFLEWAERRGAGRDARQQLASVLGAHHGRPLTSDRIALARERPALVGEGPWSEARFELLDRAASNPEVMPHLSKILSTVLHQSDLVLLSGMLILADWLASSEAYFPLFPLGDDLEVETSSRMAEAWRRFAPSHGWTPNPAGTTAELFRERFQLPSGASPHPAQSELVDCARSLEEPGLLILEAPMGSGKTEAALAAAEVLAAKFGANGLFIALPTQATSNGMFTRVHDWADSSGMGTSIFLAHGRSTMNDEFEELVAEPRFNGVDESGGGELRSGKEPQNDGSVMVHRWFSGSKKGPLSNLVVGTIDQVLFAALQSRHVSVRHLALAGKVVVIDEVHAYDTYMGEFLTRAVQWLGAYGVPVVLLSATLPAERRQDLVRAYEEGRRLDRGERVRSRGRSMIDDSVLGGNIGYPVISASTELGQPRLPGWTGRRQNFAIERLDDGDGS